MKESDDGIITAGYRKRDLRLTPSTSPRTEVCETPGQTALPKTNTLSDWMVLRRSDKSYMELMIRRTQSHPRTTEKPSCDRSRDG
jgi:hypothetical protein